MIISLYNEHSNTNSLQRHYKIMEIMYFSMGKTMNQASQAIT